MDNPKEAADIALGREPEVPESPESVSPGESDSEGSGGSENVGGLRDMLSNTSPDKSPADVSGQLDFSTPWHNHAELALEKAVSGSGTPAWVNLLTAVVLLVTQELDVPTPGESDSGGSEDSSDSGVGGVV